MFRKSVWENVALFSFIYHLFLWRLLGRGEFAEVNIEKLSFILEYKVQQITGEDSDSFGERDFKHNGETVCSALRLIM